MKFYAGIGPRKTPEPIQKIMSSIAAQMYASNWTLRSGHAAGADEAFEVGTPQKQIFLPWEGFRGGRSNGKYMGHLVPSQKQMQIAEDHHPAWHRCNNVVRLLLARNVPIILGETLEDPVKCVITWLPPQYQGGTSHALRIASTWGIPVFNIHLPEDQKALVAFTERTDHET
jgi:hypothetical protein